MDDLKNHDDEEYGVIEYHFDVTNYGRQVTLTVVADRCLDSQNYLAILEAWTHEMAKEEDDFIQDALNQPML